MIHYGITMAQRTPLEDARVLIVGLGGLGSPAAVALANAGIGTLGLVDDDRVERENLHRQVFFSDADVGRKKIEAIARRLQCNVNSHDTRLLPATADALVRAYDIVLEGSDNFATKFLAVDACMRAGVPLISASAIRWVGMAFATTSEGACYRCLFESAPEGAQETCDLSGVVGPVVGMTAATQAALALRHLGGEQIGGTLIAINGAKEELSDIRRERVIMRRDDCDCCAAYRRAS